MIEKAFPADIEAEHAGEPEIQLAVDGVGEITLPQPPHPPTLEVILGHEGVEAPAYEPPPEPNPVGAIANLGTPNHGDIIVLRYLNGVPAEETRKKDYRMLQEYFLAHGASVRVLGLPGTLALERVSELDMARYGWVKRSKAKRT